MKKPTKRDTINLFFSAFLIIAFIVCAHFFSQYASALSQPLGSIIPILVYAVFGLLVFYATRVGDGKAVKRFSLVTLIVMVLPSLYIIVASLAPGLPLYDVFSNANGSGLSVIVTLASIALGYGIPYSFLSGFEVADDEAVEEETGNPVQGGIEADLADDENAEDTAFEESEEVKQRMKANQQTKPITVKTLDSLLIFLKSTSTCTACAGTFCIWQKIMLLNLTVLIFS